LQRLIPFSWIYSTLKNNFGNGCNGTIGSHCNGEPLLEKFNAAWKSLKINIETNLSDDKQKVIDEIVGNF
jgi:hypothetical protein